LQAALNFGELLVRSNTVDLTPNLFQYTFRELYTYVKNLEKNSENKKIIENRIRRINLVKSVTDYELRMDQRLMIVNCRLKFDQSKRIEIKFI